MKKIILLLLTLTSLSCFSQEKIEIPQGTLIKAALINDLKGGKVEVGDKIDFELSEPLIINDRVVLHKGLKIAGLVTEARASGVLGRKGKLGFTINYLYLENGKVAKLMSTQSKKLNGSGVEVAIATVVLTPIALLIPGKGAKYKAGTEFDCFIDENIEM